MSTTPKQKGGSRREPETARFVRVGRNQDTPDAAECKDGTPAVFDPEIAFFPSVAAKGRGRNITLREFLRQVREGDFRQQIKSLRALSDPKAYDEQKKKLPAVMLSASTANGGAKVPDLAFHSGILQLDVDKLASQAEAEALRERMRDDPHALAALLSPGGRGVKVLVRVATSFDLHEASFLAAQAWFKADYGVDIDRQCRNLNRLCFVSCDPDLVEKADAAVLPHLRGSGAEAGSPGVPVETTQGNSSLPLLLPPDKFLNEKENYLEFCIAGLPLLPAICKNKSTNEKCRNHTRGSMERHRRQSHQRPWRRPSLPRRDLLLVWRIQKRGNHPARMGYVGMLPHRRNRCQLLLFKRPAELEVRGYCTSCRER